MSPFLKVLIAAGFLVITMGLPVGLYRLLTISQRRTMREIRKSAAQLGWNYRLRRWQGSPAAFRIDGETPGGVPWILTSGPGSETARGWRALLALRFPTLGGEPDFAVIPRDGKGGGLPWGQAIGAGTESRVAVFSSTAAGGIAFLREAREEPSGLAAFDAAYQILTRPGRMVQPLIDPALAARILQWPADSIAPHSVLAWRDPFGVHLHVRLPEPPNWPNVAYAASLGEEWAMHVPPPATKTTPHGLVDQITSRFLE